MPADLRLVPAGARSRASARLRDYQQHNEKTARRGASHDWRATRHENPLETPDRSGGPRATGSDRDTAPSEAPGSEQARSRPVSASAQRVAAAALARRGSDDGKRAVAPLVSATASTLSESVGDVDAVCVERAA